MKLKYDLPSYLRIAGYMTQPRYEGQPWTCRLCGHRDHQVKDCDMNPKRTVQKTPVVKTPQEQGNAAIGNTVESGNDSAMDIDTSVILKSVTDNISLVRDHQGISVNTPALANVISKQLTKFKKNNADRQRERRQRREEKNSKNNKRKYIPISDMSYSLPLNGSGRGSRGKYDDKPGGSKRDKYGSDEGNWFDGHKVSVATSNSYAHLSHDDMEHTDEYTDPDSEGHKQHVEHRNSVHY